MGVKPTSTSWEGNILCLLESISGKPKNALSHWERRGPQTFFLHFCTLWKKIRRLSPKLRRYNFSFETHMYSKVHYFRTKVHYRPVRYNQNFQELCWFGIVLCVHFSVNFHYLDFFRKWAFKSYPGLLLEVYRLSVNRGWFNYVTVTSEQISELWSLFIPLSLSSIQNHFFAVRLTSTWRFTFQAFFISTSVFLFFLQIFCFAPWKITLFNVLIKIINQNNP